MDVFRWIAMAGSAFLILHLFSSRIAGEYWGPVPTLVIALACPAIYLKTTRTVMRMNDSSHDSR